MTELEGHVDRDGSGIDVKDDGFAPGEPRGVPGMTFEIGGGSPVLGP
jgi:hypothetical protein